MTDEEKRSEEEKEATEGEGPTEAASEESSEENSSDDGGSDDDGSEEKGSDESDSEESSSEDDDSNEASSDDESAEAPAEEKDELPETQDSPQIAAAAAHGHDDHDHGPHTAPMSLLIGVLVALSLLTILTVAVTVIDLGSEGNFIVAMVIATVKATLVMGYFMHMFWDAKFNVVAFTSSFLFVLLFLAMTLLDRGEYQLDMDVFEVDKKAQT